MNEVGAVGADPGGREVNQRLIFPKIQGRFC
jgi:hypothetical protein